MDKISQLVKKKWKFVRGLFPAKLPQGVKEFDSFVSDIFEAYGLPDMPSYRHAIATMIMHLSPTTFYKAKYYFAVSVKKSQANQVAYEMIQAIKEKEKKVAQADALADAQKEV